MQDGSSWEEVGVLGGREGADCPPALLPLALRSSPWCPPLAPALLCPREQVRPEVPENQGPPVPPQWQISAMAVGAGGPIPPSALALQVGQQSPSGNMLWFPRWCCPAGSCAGPLLTSASSPAVLGPCPGSGREAQGEVGHRGSWSLGWGGGGSPGSGTGDRYVGYYSP